MWLAQLHVEFDGLRASSTTCRQLLEFVAEAHV